MRFFPHWFSWPVEQPALDIFHGSVVEPDYNFEVSVDKTKHYNYQSQEYLVSFIALIACGLYKLPLILQAS